MSKRGLLCGVLAGSLVWAAAGVKDAEAAIPEVFLINSSGQIISWSGGQYLAVGTPLGNVNNLLQAFPNGPPRPATPPPGYQWVWRGGAWALVVVGTGYLLYEAYQYNTLVDQVMSDPNINNVGLTQDDFDCMSINVFSSGYWSCFGNYWFGSSTPSRPPRPGPRAGANGDPHLVTFDGLYYDLQIAGEVVMAKSGADFEVQARMEPWSTGAAVSVTTAVAMKVGSHRVGVYQDGVRVDGELLTSSEPVSLDGGWLLDNGGQVEVAWPAGDRVRVSFGSSMNLDIDLAPVREGFVTGALGDADGDPTNDIALADGTVLPQPVSTEDLYGDFAASKRVTVETSLFDYAEGESTATYTDLSFPDVVTPTDLLTILDPATDPDLAAAIDACDAAGVTDPALSAGCIHDVYLTGDEGFVEGAAAALEPVAAIVVDESGDTQIVDPSGGEIIDPTEPPPPDMSPPPPPPDMSPLP